LTYQKTKKKSKNKGQLMIESRRRNWIKL